MVAVVLFGENYNYKLNSVVRIPAVYRCSRESEIFDFSEDRYGLLKSSSN